MNIEHSHIEFCCLLAGLCDSVRNIVEFQVQECPLSLLLNHIDHFRASVGKELFSYFEHAYPVL